ncbi:MAG: BMP family ABC transporter substrate-binding protein [Candidatus Competibacterales bacterium]|nr:BMP family ABC transporter substrate-binding protein [Candidatus Competibacterales bacterium]
MRIDRRRFCRHLLSTTLLSLALGQAATAQEPLRIGFVYVSPIGDAGWTYQHELGRQAVEEALGERVATKYIENVPEGGESERVIRGFAADGYGLVFTTSFGYMNPTVKVARQFPQVIFEHATGYKRADNVGTYSARFYEGRYLAGMVAGAMTESGVAGYVAAFPIPEVLRGINAFTLGMRAVNPDAQVKVIWVNSWFDPGREREAADVLLAQGADVITHHTDSTAAVQAAEEANAYAVAYHSDMSKYGPNAQLTAVSHHWGAFYTMIAEEVLNGTWESRDVWGGIAAGMIRLAPLNPVVPEAIAQRVEQTRQAIVDGDFHPFQGPITGQDSSVRVPEGTTLSDQDLLTMEWYVEGVQGELPK